MSSTNPFLTDEPLNPKSHAHMVARHDLVDLAVEHIEKGDYCLFVGPKYSGRTTLLRLIQQRLQGAHTICVILKAVDLEARDDDAFFASILDRLATEIRLSAKDPVVAQSEQIYKAAADHEAWNGVEHYARLLLDSWPGRLVILFDGIERLPPNCLVDLSQRVATLFNRRRDTTDAYLHRLSIHFAGSVSLRYLSLYDKPDVSPFNECTVLRISDLPLHDARRYLESINNQFDLRFRDAAISEIIAHAGGDLNSLHRLCRLCVDARDDDGEITSDDVGNVIQGLLRQEFEFEESIRYVAHLVEEDLPTLRLVLDLNEHGSKEYAPDAVHPGYMATFGMTYPELTGAVRLDRDEDGQPVRWRFRNQLIGSALKRVFSPTRVLQSLSVLGQYDEAIQRGLTVLDDIRERITNNPIEVTHGTTGLLLILMAMTSKVYVDNDTSEGYAFLGMLLRQAFGATDCTYFRKEDDQLRAPAFLHDLGFDGNEGQTIDLRAANPAEHPEVRVLKTKLFEIQTSITGGANAVLPLSDLNGDVGGVVTFTLEYARSSWARLNLAMTIIHRTLQAINVAIDKVEKDRHVQFETVVESARSGGRTRSSVRVFVGHEYNKELEQNMRDYLGRLRGRFEFQYEQTGSVLLDGIRDLIRGADICIFEMSRPNHNVMLEVGMTVALNRPSLLFARNRRHQEFEPPPNLANIHWLKYQAYPDLLPNLTNAIGERLRASQGNAARSDYCQFSGRALPAITPTQPYVAVIDHDHCEDRDEYREAVRDVCRRLGLPALFITDSRIQGLPSMIEGLSSSDLVLHQELLILRNAHAVFARGERMDVESGRDLRSFVTLGMALEACRGNVVVTRREFDLDSRPTSIPSDIVGVEAPYGSNAELATLLIESAKTSSA